MKRDIYALWIGTIFLEAAWEKKLIKNLLIHAETRILPSWSLQTETAMPCSELQRKSQFKSRGVVRMRVILEMSLKKGARISRLIPNKWKVCFHTKSCKFVTDSLDNLASDVYLTSPTFSYLLELLWELKVIIGVNLIEYLALNKHSIRVSHMETHNNADCKSIFQGSSILRESNKNKMRAKQLRTGLNSVSPHSQGQTGLSTHHNDILTLQHNNLYSKWCWIVNKILSSVKYGLFEKSRVYYIFKSFQNL